MEENLGGFFGKILFLGNLNTHCGAQTQPQDQESHDLPTEPEKKTGGGCLGDSGG